MNQVPQLDPFRAVRRSARSGRVAPPAATLAVALLLALAPSAFATLVVNGSLTAEFDVSPGAHVVGSLPVRNTGDQDATVRVYQTDYLFFADGSNDYDPIGSQPRSNGAWVHLAADTLTVAAGASVPIQYTVDIPDDASLAGSYWSMVMIEEVVPEPEPSPTAGLTARTLTRYGVQVVTNVVGAQGGTLEFSRPVLTRNDGGSVVLTVDVSNGGDSMLSGHFTLELYDASGASLATVEGQDRRLYPATSVLERFDLGDAENGTLTAVILGDAGGDQVFGARYDLDLSAN